MRILNDKGLVASLDFLGENVAEPRQASAAVTEYLRLLDAMHQKGLDGNVSVKLTALGLDLSEDLCLANAAQILKRAARHGTFVRIDMEGSAYTQRTLDVFFKLRNDFDNVGVVLQAMLRRSEEDAHRLAEAGASVRLCKGAYREPRRRAFARMSEIRSSYIRLLEILLRGGGNVGIATHDDKLHSGARGLLQRLGIRRECYEFQMLYGVRPVTQLALHGEGHKMRIYVPYGTSWLPYTLRRIRERRQNFFFVLGSLFRK